MTKKVKPAKRGYTSALDDKLRALSEKNPLTPAQQQEIEKHQRIQSAMHAEKMITKIIPTKE